MRGSEGLGCAPDAKSNRKNARSQIVMSVGHKCGAHARLQHLLLELPPLPSEPQLHPAPPPSPPLQPVQTPPLDGEHQTRTCVPRQSQQPREPRLRLHQRALPPLLPMLPQLHVISHLRARLHAVRCQSHGAALQLPPQLLARLVCRKNKIV